MADIKCLGSRWFLFIVINIILIWSIGFVIYGEIPDRTKGFEVFLKAADFQDAVKYYGRILPANESISLIYPDKNSTEMWCMIGKETGLRITKFLNRCDTRTVIVDNHAASVLVLSSWHMRGIMLSEFITGHIKVEGITMTDIYGWLI